MNKKMKILVIDDSETNNLLIKSMFEEKGSYEVLTLGKSTGVVKYVIKNKPDLILLDIMMPRKSGYIVLEELKINPETSKIPVIIVSAIQEEDQVYKAKRLGAAEYIKKPVGNKILISKVNEFLNIR